MSEVAKEFFDIIQYTFPSLLVFFTAYFILKQFFQNEHRQRMLDIKNASAKTINPIRLQAYERFVIYMERISPDNMIMRLHQGGMSARKLHKDCLQSIRTEFEHNTAQQIYISKPAWELIKTAKEETIKLVNMANSKVKDDSSGLELSKVMLSMSSQIEKLPNQVAIDYLKKEIKLSF